MALKDHHIVDSFLNKPKLSILIASMPCRADNLMELLDALQSQYKGRDVEITIDQSMEYNIGVKRNRLLEAASGDYVVFIDDDDHIEGNYITEILTAIETGVDCIGISGVITTDGEDLKQWHISKDFGRWFEENNVYCRTPNHISPVRRELALQAGFPAIEHGEDYEYSMRLLPLLKTEIKIAGNIYHYDFKERK